MTGTVVLYKNTGLDLNNVLDNRNILATAESISGGSIAIKQDRGLTFIRLEKSYNEIKEVDYAEINNELYFVQSVRMINDNCAELTLVFDAFSTVGIDNILVIGGFITRCHVSYDKPFLNTIPEPFTPKEHFSIVWGGALGNNIRVPDTSEGAEEGATVFNTDQYRFVVSTANISEKIETASFYRCINGDASILDWLKSTFVGISIADIPQLSEFTTYYLGYSEKNPTPAYVPGTAIFNLDNPDVNKNICRLYALGLDTVILYSYAIPAYYLGTEHNVEYADGVDAGRVKNIYSVSDVIDSSINLTQIYGKDRFQNAKVYSGQFTQYGLTNIASGERVVFQPEQIVFTSENTAIYTPKLYLASDTRYNGYPMICPRYYMGKSNSWYFGSIKGTQWKESPLRFYGNSGAELQNNIAQYQFDLQLDKMARSLGTSLGMSAVPQTPIASSQMNMNAGFYDGITTAMMNPVGQTQGLLNTIYGVGDIIRQSELSQAMYDLRSQVPNIKFSAIPTFADYFGNVFVDYVITMTENDMQRFDDFLTQFGYAVYEKFNRTMFVSREHFNYLQGEKIQVECNADAYTTNIIKKQIEAGVRIWHEMPNFTAMTENPIAGLGEVESEE